jgi:TolB-like protein/DNA-binding winged helix-turn-helix (wHTH) protein/Flp pilus assembly protein TadD
MSVPVPSLPEEIRFSVYVVDTRAGELRKNGIRVKLEARPFRILTILLERPGSVVTRDELRSRLWPDGTFVDFDHSISSAVRKLRDALCDSAATPRFVETAGRGYRFIYPVESRDGMKLVSFAPEIAAADAESRTEAPLTSDANNSSTIHARIAADANSSAKALATRTWLILAAATIFIALAIVAGVVAGSGGHGKPVDSVAVLPFVNASGDPDNDYLSDGITESVINNLSPLHNLRVMAVSTMFRYKGKQADPQIVGHDLGVRAVLSGKLIQRADTVIVQAELVDVSNGSQLWGGQYARKVADVFALQEDLSRVISEKLRLRLTGEEKQRLTKRYTASTEAYQSYLRGRYFWSQWSPEQSLRAIAYFQEAISADPGYALPYAGLADTYLSRAWFGEDPPREAVPKAKEAALKALEIDDGIAEAHASLGFIAFLYDWDWTGAQRHFERAIEINPGYANAHNWYSFYLAALGKEDQALAEARRAVDLDPASPGMNQILGIQLTYGRRFDEAIQQYRKALEMGYHDAHLGLGNAYAEKGMYREALSEFQQYSAVDRDTPRAISSLGYAYAQLGERKAALRVLGELRTLSKRRYVSSASLAMVYIGLGDKDEAFALLNKAYDEHSFTLAFLNVNPQFDSLRSDPRFGDLLHRTGLSK